MTAAIVAQQAVDMGDSQKHVEDIGRLLIEDILDGAARDHAAHHQVQRALLVAVGAGGGDQVARHLVVGLAGLQSAPDVIVECLHTVGIAADLRILGIVMVEIAEEHGPFVDPLRLGQQLIDEAGALAGAGIGHEAGDPSGGGDAAGEIERHAADELIIGRRRSRRHSRGLHCAEDVRIDAPLGQLIEGIGAAASRNKS